MLPYHGYFECDFVYLIQKPNPAEEISKKELDLLKKFVEDKQNNSEPKELALAFANVAEFFTFKSD